MQRVIIAHDVLFYHKADYDHTLTLTINPEEAQIDTLLKSRWNKLKKIHSAYLIKDTSPACFAAYLSIAITNVGTITDLVNNNNNSASHVPANELRRLQNLELRRLQQNFMQFVDLSRSSEFEDNAQAEIARLREENKRLKEKNALLEKVNVTLKRKSAPETTDSMPIKRQKTFQEVPNDVNASSHSSSFFNVANLQEEQPHVIASLKVINDDDNDDYYISLEFNSLLAKQEFEKNFSSFSLGEIVQSKKENKLRIYPGDDDEDEVFIEVMVPLLQNHFNLPDNRISRIKKP